MTTKPTAKRFRIRRGPAPNDPGSASDPLAEAQSRAQSQSQPEDLFLGPQDDGFGSAPFPGSAKAASDRDAGAADIGEIRKEGLTGRQLRLARRLAQKHGIEATSDFEAVRLLRARGIDPFKRESLLELVVPGADAKADGTGASAKRADEDIHLPQTVNPDAGLPAEPIDPMTLRARTVREIQRDIVSRRRRRFAFLFARLAVFVILPTFLAGWYYYQMATPLYATKSSLRIDQAGAPASGGGLGGLLSGTGLATSQDAVGVQDYLASLEAMLRLEGDIGFRSYFSGDEIDPLLRLPADASNEDAYKLYKRLVKIGYDPTEGVIRLEVSAPDPEVSVAFSEALIAYSEEQADSLTQQIREDQMAGAFDALGEAETKMAAAQARVLELQEQLGVLDPVSETAALMTQISLFETQLAEKQLQLQQLLDNTQPNAARVSGVRGDIARLETLVADLRSQMTSAGTGQRSLARISGELSMAEIDLETRTLMMQESLRQVETARIEANRQVTYLSRIVSPVVPQEASYPRAFENTLLALFIFSGIYLMASITISILREQV